MKRLFWLLPIFCLVSAPARAIHFKKEHLYLDANANFASVGNASSSVASSPTLLGYGLGLSIGYDVIRVFFLGFAADAEWVGQYTAPDDATGNRRGNRLQFSPQIGARIGDFVFKGDYQFMGNYNLSTSDAAGNTVSYTKPSGFRLQALYGLTEDIYGGLIYQSVSFSNQHLVGPNAGDTALSQNFSLTQFGVTLAYTF